MSRLAEKGIRCAFIDIIKLGGRNVTPEQWYAGMALEIGRSTGLRKEIWEYWKAEWRGPEWDLWNVLVNNALWKGPIRRGPGGKISFRVKIG